MDNSQNQSLKEKSHSEKPWYWIPSEKLEIPPETRKILEDYSRISPDDVLQHVISTRDKAWSCIPYPCIGGFRFLTLSLHPPLQAARDDSVIPSGGSSPYFDQVVGKLSSDPSAEFLDIGCCFGQDVRAAAYYTAQNDNVAKMEEISHRFHGLDIKQDLIDLGYELFNDREKFRGSFHVGNILSDSSSNLAELISNSSKLANKISIIHAALFFHLFNREEQILAATRIIQMILKDETGVIVTGRQLGNQNSGSYRSKVNPSKMRYLHNAESWKELWREIGGKTGTKWDVQVEIGDVSEYSGVGNEENEEEGAIYMIFCCTRIA